jgi:4-diphosphocytidyl-2-C-methyl-D-erythritol kinase
LAKPPINVSTADVYGRFNARKADLVPTSREVLKAIQTQDFHRMCDAMGNMLEDVTLEAYPEVFQLKECMQRLGADGVLMSGSGPTVFGLVSKESKVARIYNGLRGFCKEVYVVRMLT